MQAQYSSDALGCAIAADKHLLKQAFASGNYKIPWLFAA